MRYGIPYKIAVAYSQMLYIVPGDISWEWNRLIPVLNPNIVLYCAMVHATENLQLTYLKWRMEISLGSNLASLSKIIVLSFENQNLNLRHYWK